MNIEKIRLLAEDECSENKGNSPRKQDEFIRMWWCDWIKADKLFSLF